MRIERLDLERYGPFTDRVLRFRPDARLHVIYGPNEAGKSSALAAVTDLLFGFEHRTTQDFIHRKDELRIGAEIAARDGRRLAFRRRKGTKNTLLDPSDAPLADDALAPFLGGLGRDVFRRAFGLSTDGLRAGGREMAENKGDAAAQLFAAASGLEGLTRIRRGLDAEAEQIFPPRASKDRRFFRALDRFEAARKAIKEQELKAGDWKALNETIASLEERVAELDAARRAKAVARERLERLKRAAPVVREIDETLGEIAAIGDLPDLPPGFGEGLTRALDRLDLACKAHDHAAETAAEAARADAAILVDETLIARAEEINALFAGTKAHAEVVDERPRAEAKAAALASSLADIARRLGLPDVETLAAAQPTDATLARAGALIEDGKRLAERAAGLARQIEDETAGLAARTRERAAGRPAIDPAPLEARRAALAPVAKLIDARADLATRIADEARALAERARRQTPAIDDLDRLAGAALPSLETQDRFRAALDTLAQEIRAATDAIAKAEAGAGAAEARLAALAGPRPIPTPEAIAAARAERAALWDRLRGTLFGEAGALAGAALAKAVAGFEVAVAEADRLADDAVGEGDRVARHALETRTLTEARSAHTAARTALAGLEGRWTVLHAEWADLWAPAGIAPLTPVEMRAWSAEVGRLLADRDKLATERTRLAALDREIAAAEPALRALAGEAGVAEAGMLPLWLVAGRIGDALSELSTAWTRARELEAHITGHRDRLAALAAADEAAGTERARWRDAFEAVLPALALRREASIGEAEAALKLWAALPAMLSERSTASNRSGALMARIAAFEAEAARLAAAAAPDLAGLPAATLAGTLSTRLAAARTEETRKIEAARRRTEADATHRSAERERAEAEAALAALATEAGLSADADLRLLVHRLATRARLESLVHDRRRHLRLQADGLAEDALRADLAGFEHDAAAAEIAGIEAEQERLDHAARDAFADLEARKKERAALAEGTGSELAHARRRIAEAEIASAARDWAVLRIASLMLAAAAERHRAGRQDPLMVRAGELFAILTGGAFSGLGQDYGEGDEPRLVGIRANGGGAPRVPADGMSEGTQDQLYLALRLAYLEAHARRAEPPPFLGDDLFASFDEDRTGHGLDVLAAVGADVQMILFTHHRHVAAIARDRLGAAADVIELA